MVCNSENMKKKTHYVERMYLSIYGKRFSFFKIIFRAMLLYGDVSPQTLFLKNEKILCVLFKKKLYET